MGAVGIGSSGRLGKAHAELLLPDERERLFDELVAGNASDERAGVAPLALDERAPHFARLALDLDRYASVRDVVEYVRLVQDTLRAQFANYGSLVACVMYCHANGHAHIVFPDVVWAVGEECVAARVLRGSVPVRLPRTLNELLEAVRRSAAAVFCPLLRAASNAAGGAPFVRTEPDVAALAGARLRVAGSQRGAHYDADAVYRVEAIVSDAGRMLTLDDIEADEMPADRRQWWRQLGARSGAADPDAFVRSAAPLSVFPSAAQWRRIMRAPAASVLRMTSLEDAAASSGGGASASSDVVAELLFGDGDGDDDDDDDDDAMLEDDVSTLSPFVASQVRVVHADRVSCVAHLARARGDGVECGPCSAAGRLCGASQPLCALLRVYPNDRGVVWHYCAESHGIVLARRCVAVPVQWLVTAAAAVASLDSALAAPLPPSASIWSLPLLPLVYRFGLRNADGAQLCDVAALDRQHSIGWFMRALASASNDGRGVRVSEDELRRVSELAARVEVRDYDASVREPGKPYMSDVFANEVEAIADAVCAKPARAGDQRPLVVRIYATEPGHGKTTCLAAQVVAVLRRVRTCRHKRPLMILCVFSRCNIGRQLHKDVSTALAKAGLVPCCRLSYYADEKGAEWRAVFDDACDAYNRCDGESAVTDERPRVEAIVRFACVDSLHASVMRPAGAAVPFDVVLIDESEAMQQHLFTSSTMSRPGCHEQAHAAMLQALSRAHFWGLYDRGAGLATRAFVAHALLDSVGRAHRSRQAEWRRDASVQQVELRVRSKRRVVEMTDAAVGDGVLAALAVEQRKRVIVLDTSIQSAKRRYALLQRAIARYAKRAPPGWRAPRVALMDGETAETERTKLAADPLGYLTENDIDVLIHTGVFGRASSINEAYFDVSLVFAHAHTDYDEVRQGQERARLLKPQAESGERVSATRCVVCARAGLTLLAAHVCGV